MLRNPSRSALFAAYRQCDVFVHQGISLKWIWPLLLGRKPWFIVYHQAKYQQGYKGTIKKLCSFFAHNIAVSHTTYDGYALKHGDIIYNSYDSQTFRNTNPTGKRKGILYVGKVTETKGCFMLLKAFEEFKQKTGSKERLTFIGDGSGRKELERLAAASPYAADIEFLGFKRAPEICTLQNQAELQIVPSMDKEAFGVVVLEALASGCAVIGSDTCGVEEALGGCGITFRRGDSHALAAAMERYYTLTDKEKEAYREKSTAWLQHLSLTNVAQRYIDCFKKVVKNE